MVEYIIIHCSDSPDGRDDTIKQIDAWHLAKGFKRLRTRREEFNPLILACGYQYVIKRDGTLQTGRAENEPGAHCLGYNTLSIGVCLIGRKRFDLRQWDGLSALLDRLTTTYPKAKIVGHCNLDPKRKPSCPGFDVPKYAASREPPAGSIFA